jgi:pimeloyl-ACP methyl ester carboxylesterase
MRRLLSIGVAALVIAAAGPPLAARLFGWGADPGALPARGRTVPIGDDLALDVVEAGGGPPLILVHGLPSSAADWAETPARLAARGFRAIAYDRVGYGFSSRGSTAPDRYTYASNARDLLALMDALGIARAPLVGWSYGGAVVQTAAAMAPERVPRLVLVAAVGPAQPRGDDPLSRLLATPVAGPLLRWIGSVPPLARALTQDSLVQAFAGEAAIPPGWAARTRAMLALPGTLDAFVLEAQRGRPDTLHPERLTVPTLIIQGGADTLVPPTVAADLHTRIAGSTLATVPDGSHMLPVTHADVIAAEIDRFLR